MEQSSFYHISGNGEIITLTGINEAINLLKSNGYIWFNFIHSTREELSVLIEPLSLHPLSIEDCTDENQVPKIEDFQNYSFIIFNALYYSNREVIADEVDIFVGSNFIITASGYSSTSQYPLSEIVPLVKRNINNVKVGPSRLAHLVIDNIVDRMGPAIEAVEDEIDTAEEEILKTPGDFDASRLTFLRRDLLSLRKNLFHEREILVRIIRNDCHFIPEKVTLHYRDIYDHISNFFEMTESNRDNVTSLMELYASMLNNKMAHDSNQTNASVRRLTLITTIFMPMTLIAGIFGMSEWTVMTGPGNMEKSYLFFAGILLVIGLANFALLKWLERKD